MKVLNLLLKEAVDVDGDGRETIKDDIMDGYYTMAQKGAIPAVLLGAGAAYKSKGVKNKIVHGLAGVGAGYLGTFALKSVYDAYDRHKRAKQQQLLAQLQQGI
jgi:hypothetical protein